MNEFDADDFKLWIRQAELVAEAQRKASRGK